MIEPRRVSVTVEDMDLTLPGRPRDSWARA
jgi:hypothetical protein